jgi:hypothetical protein
MPEADKSNRISDAEFMRLLHQSSMKRRRRCVAKLLAGNDTRCFTTAAYIAAWCEESKGDPTARRVFDAGFITVGEHLRSVGMAEVEPGVWTPIDDFLGMYQREKV